MKVQLHELSVLQGHIVVGIVAFFVGLILWLIYRWLPDLLPFAIAWVIIRPLFKITQWIERETTL